MKQFLISISVILAPAALVYVILQGSAADAAWTAPMAALVVAAVGARGSYQVSELKKENTALRDECHNGSQEG